MKITSEDLLAWQKNHKQLQKAKDKAGEHFCSFIIDRGNYLKELQKKKKLRRLKEQVEKCKIDEQKLTEKINMVLRHTKECLISSRVRKIQVKTVLITYHIKLTKI